MKVLILVPQLPKSLTNIKGGAHAAVINLLYGFIQLDIMVRVISFSKEVSVTAKFKFGGNIDIIYENEGPFSYHSINYLFNGNSIIKKHIKEYNPDLIHYQAGNSFLLTAINGLFSIKHILTIHGMASEESKRKLKLNDRLKWKMNHLIQLILFPKNIIHLSGFSEKKYKSKKNDNYDIIPNALEQSYFKIPLKQKTDNILLYVGVIDNNKNIINVLRAIKQLKDNNIDYTLEVLGDFNNQFYKNYIHSYIKFNGIEENIHFRGWVNTSIVKEFLAKSDILVVSSFHESLPMVIAEAMAASKVVVASSVGGIPEMINDGIDGFLFNLKNPYELVEILENLYKNDKKIYQIKNEAKIAAMKKYNARNVAKKTIDFYKKVLSN